MSRTRRWLLVGVASLLVLLIAAALLEPNRILVGLLQGDAFFQWRPTRYWREVLRQDGVQGRISDETIATFKLRESSVPVLRVCALDPDRNVRWPAVFLLGRVGRLHTHAALPGLREALQDDHVEVRLQATIALGNMGTNAMSVGPDLVEAMKDPDAQVRFMAEKALWYANPRLASKEGSWRTFESPRWNFSAAFPAAPAEEKKPALFPETGLVVNSFAAHHGVSMYIVAVTEYPLHLFQGTDEERLDASRDMMLLGMGAKLVDEKPFKRGTIKGREISLEKTIERDGVKNTTILKSRIFWVDRRQYHVQAAYNTELSVIPAADYFLDSFQYPSTGVKAP